VRAGHQGGRAVCCSLVIELLRLFLCFIWHAYNGFCRIWRAGKASGFPVAFPLSSKRAACNRMLHCTQGSVGVSTLGCWG
jgi:hypothetical protein